MRNKLILFSMLCSFFYLFLSCTKDVLQESDSEFPEESTGLEDEDDTEFNPNTQSIDLENAIKICFSDTGVVVVNSFEDEGVTITDNNGHIEIRSTITDKELNYILSGITSNGSVKIYGEKKFALVLNGLSLTNPQGAAINNQCSKKIILTLVDSTNNRLIDSTQYNYTSGEDMKGTLFSEGNMEIIGNGSLQIKGRNKHGLCVDGSLFVKEGFVTISEAASDGIHTNDEFTISGGTLLVKSVGDGIESESKTKPMQFLGGNVEIITSGEKGHAIKTKNNVVIDTDGKLKITNWGDASKGIKPTGNLNILQGDITIITKGETIWDEDELEMSSAAGVKTGGNIYIQGGTITIVSSGMGGKGLSSDSDLVISGGIIDITCSGNGEAYTNSSGEDDSYSSQCIKSDNDLSILGGTLTLTNSGSGGKGLSADGNINIGTVVSFPTLNITTTGLKFIESSTSVSGIGKGQNSINYCTPKAIKSDGNITIENGTINISSADDGIKSENTITINGGTIIVSKSYEGLESIYIVINGGYLDVTASNDGINTTKGLVSGGTESNDGSRLTINGGTVISTCTEGDALDSNGDIWMNGGVLIATGPSSGVEEAIDSNGGFYMNGGVCVACGSNSNMTKAMNSASTQTNLFLTVNSGVAAGTIVNIVSGDNTLLTFKPKATTYKMLLSCPSMTKGTSYSISTGGIYSGGTVIAGILYSGGLNTGGTIRKTGMLSAGTSVNSISF